MAGSGRFEAGDGQSVVIAGGSKGLGRELALKVVAQGANVIILARGKEALEKTRDELLKVRKSDQQTVEARSVDLSDAAKVDAFAASLETLPTALFCVAGGTADEVGFFADISCEDMRACFDRNYFSAAFITHSILRRWIAQPPATGESRHIILTASTAAFVCLPGYSAYTPTKTATRALADTLRQELLLYRSQQEIRAHCAFPGTIYTDAFYEEQKRKPALCKELEGSDKNLGGLSTSVVADTLLAGLRRGNFFITMDMDTAILLNNMRGPSPRNIAVWDWILGFVGSLAWPFYRWQWDRATIQHGKSLQTPDGAKATKGQ
ncbi:MAG: hypothetical protein M1838_000623 [Thelocarpon superellum]|nr:MAG: hypothetical protein M1838_000623 [Thelocarpon superellum]